MKTGVIALTAASLVGSALAVPGDYGAWPASSSSSTPAAPVKASSTEPCDEDSYDATSSGSAAWPEWTASSSASSSAAAWGYVSSSTTVKASSSTKSFATSSATWGSGAWGSAVADSVAPSSVPAWFDPASAYACCKTVVTETVYGSMPAKPVVTETQTSIAWVIPSPAPVWSSSSSSSSFSSSSAAAWPTVAWSSSAPAAPIAPVDSVTWSSPAAVWTSSAAPVAPVVPVAPTWSSPAAVASSPAAAASSPVSSSSGSSAGYGGISTNGNKWAMTYTPYSSTGGCKSAAEVDIDIATIAGYGFSTVRLYATDCSGLVNIGASAKAHGLKVIVGIFIDTTGLTGAATQISQVTSWGNEGNWDIVSMIVVGNEAVFNGYVSASQLAGLISSSKSSWAAAGYTGPVTTTEPVNIILEYALTLCPAIDVVAANIQPFFTSSVAASWAGTFVLTELALIEAACLGKTAYNLEAGWPSSGSSNGDASATTTDQKTAIDDIIAKAGDKTAIFSFSNDAWKAPGDLGVEQYFGCGGLF